MRNLASTVCALIISLAAFAQTPAKTTTAPAQKSGAVVKSTPEPKKAPGRHYPISKNQQNLNLKVHVNGMKSGYILLAYYFGDKQYILDTGYADIKGNITFQADTAVPGGIYILTKPGAWFTEVILTEEQNFSLDIQDTLKTAESVKVSGSKENTSFYEHQKFIAQQSKAVEPLRAGLERAKAANKKDSVAYFNKKISAIDSAVKAYKRGFTVKYPNTFMTKIIKLSDEPDFVPYEKCPKKADGTIDSTYNYWVMRNSYWANMDWTDERLLRTPVYHNKMKTWVDRIIPQHPDSLSLHVNWLIDQTQQADLLYRYTVSVLTYQFESSKIMGFDAVFVSIAENNHMKGKCWWISDETTEKIIKHAKQLKYCLLGNQAVNLFLQDSAGKVVELGKIKADYTILVFWDPTCGHCKTEIPAIKSYTDSLKKAGVSVEVYAIYSELDYPTWRKYIREHNHTWKDVCAKDEVELATAKYYYEVYSTPTLYVMDANKKIIAKRLDDKGLKNWLNRRIDQDKKK